ncbi:MAG: hypothetical protein Ct9H90mP3_5860 [Flammeovirgaceae bacterium]|nr:MAG: hypothetical protein Ct9H90mP3_5860 [Flammeovirgaceae bacterium]
MRMGWTFLRIKSNSRSRFRKNWRVTRLGVSLYNTEEEIDRTIEIISKI